MCTSICASKDIRKIKTESARQSFKKRSQLISKLWVECPAIQHDPDQQFIFYIFANQINWIRAYFIRDFRKWCFELCKYQACETESNGFFFLDRLTRNSVKELREFMLSVLEDRSVTRQRVDGPCTGVLIYNISHTSFCFCFIGYIFIFAFIWIEIKLVLFKKKKKINYKWLLWIYLCTMQVAFSSIHILNISFLDVSHCRSVRSREISIVYRQFQNF